MIKYFKYLFVVLIILCFSGKAFSLNEIEKSVDQHEISKNTDTIRVGHYRILVSYNEEDNITKKRSKLLAIAADLLTGPLGGHRIYLGTEVWVPVVYAVTLGGGLGFLPVSDLFVIIFTRDLEKYTNNSQIIMWL